MRGLSRKNSTKRTEGGCGKDKKILNKTSRETRKRAKNKAGNLTRKEGNLWGLETGTGELGRIVETPCDHGNQGTGIKMGFIMTRGQRIEKDRARRGHETHGQRGRS